MKSFFSKILSFFLAILMLYSTSSFTVNTHFCCNELVDMAFFSSAVTCKDKVQKKDSPIKQCTTLQEKDCCTSLSITKEGCDTYKKANTITEVDTHVFLNTFIYTYINLFEGLEENIIPLENYKPPLFYADIQILNETFLI